jgi:hypothetical protein
LSEVPWAIPDFYMAGATQKILELSRLMQSNFEFHENVHRDLFFKGVLVQSPSSLECILRFVQRKSDYLEPREIPVMLNLQSFWGIGSEELFSTLTWRGECINYDSKNVVFANSELNKSLVEIKYPQRRMAANRSDYLYLVTISSGRGIFQILTLAFVGVIKNILADAKQIIFPLHKFWKNLKY